MSTSCIGGAPTDERDLVKAGNPRLRMYRVRVTCYGAEKEAGTAENMVSISRIIRIVSC
jgi:hypothetical protein